MQKKDFPRATWTEVETAQVGEQKVSIAFSDGGSIRIARHTPKGLEYRGVMINDDQLDLLIQLSQDGTLTKVYEAFQASKNEILAAKEKRDEGRKLVQQEEKALSRAALQAQSALEAVSRLQQQIEDRRKKQA